MPTPKLLCGNNLDVLAGFDADSIDTIITDPPTRSRVQYRGGYRRKKKNRS